MPHPRLGRPLLPFVLCALTLSACTSHQVRPGASPSPVPQASFLIDAPDFGTNPPPGTMRPPCLRAARFTGIVVPGTNDARVLISPAFMNVERRNDKRSDVLILRAEVASGRHRLGAGNNVEYRLGPTVDSAGPSITTWQPQDTIRLLVPWARGLDARWLTFFLTYRATSHTGATSECSAILRSDTLRFAPEGPVP